MGLLLQQMRHVKYWARHGELGAEESGILIELVQNGECSDT